MFEKAFWLRTLLLMFMAGIILCGNISILKAKEEKPMILASDFEEGLKSWNKQGEAEFAIDQDERHSGGQSARITVLPSTKPHYQQLNREFGPVAPGDEFRATVWVLSKEIAGGTGAYCALQFLSAEGHRVGISHTKVSPDNGRENWEMLFVGGKAPKGSQKARLDLILHAQGTAWFDDVRVVQTGRQMPWPDLGMEKRQVTIDTRDIVQPRFGGVGFHVFHHVFPITKTHLENVVAKRWRELNPSFARLNHKWDWNQEMLEQVAEHLLRLKETGTEVYMATWGPKDVKSEQELIEYAIRVVDTLEYLVKVKGCTNIKYYCMSNELSLNGWGSLIDDLPKFKDYHQKLFDELKRRNLDIKLLATDASPINRWWTIEWATENMDDITGVYGGHHYINNHPLDDERFYPWFLSKLRWGANMARRKGKNFILGEFGPKQDGRVVDGIKRDTCVYWDTPQEPLVGIQIAEAVIAALNAGTYALAYWTFMDFPDDYSNTYINKWGIFKWSGNDYSPRAHYYAYGLLTKFFRGPATVFKVDCDDPYVRVGAVRNQETNTYSIAVVNRYKGDVPVEFKLKNEPVNTEFRKYVYDPENVKINPLGDLQEPVGKVAMHDGRLTDTLKQGTLTVYTTLIREEPR